MRKPKAEEHGVVAPGRQPLEEIGLHVAHGRRVQTRGVAREHLWRAIDEREVRAVTQEPLAPDAGAAGELEDTPARREPLERVDNGRGVGLPALAIAVVTALAQPPLVVLGGPSTVVRELLVQSSSRCLDVAHDVLLALGERRA